MEKMSRELMIINQPPLSLINKINLLLHTAIYIYYRRGCFCYNCFNQSPTDRNIQTLIISMYFMAIYTDLTLNVWRVMRHQT